MNIKRKRKKEKGAKIKLKKSLINKAAVAVVIEINTIVNIFN